MSSLVDFCEMRTLNGLCPKGYTWTITDGVNQGVIENKEVVEFLGAGGTTCVWNNTTHIMTITGGGATYTWDITDGVNTGTVNDTDTIEFTGSGGITTSYNVGTQIMTITGGGTGSEWYIQGNTAATIPADVKDGDTVLLESTGQTGGGAPYPDDGVLVSAASTAVGPPDTHTLTFKLNKSVSIIGDSFNNGLLRFDGTSLPQPAANSITIGPQDSILLPGSTILATQLGTVGWEIASSNDIDFIDGAGNAFMEIDPSADRLTIAKQLAGGIVLPTAISLQTRQVWWDSAIGNSMGVTLLGDPATTNYIFFGGSDGESNKGAALWNGGSGTVASGVTRPVCSVNFRLQNDVGGGGGPLAAWLLQRYTVACTGFSAGYGDIFRFESQTPETPGGRQTRFVDGCTPFYITYSIMQQVIAMNLNQILPTNLEWCNGTGPAYNGSISIPITTATNPAIRDFSSCCTRFFNDQIMPLGGGEVIGIGSRFMAMDTGTGCYRIELVFRIYNRTGTGTYPCIQFQLYTATNAAVPIWTIANKVYTATLEENVAAAGRTSWTSGTAVWYCGLNHGNGIKIMAMREVNATSTDPVYVDPESTTLAITKMG